MIALTSSIVIVNRRNKRQIEKLAAEGWLVIDVTNRSTHDTWKRFAPEYPHGGIPVPGRQATSLTVEGVWQGLKTFKDGSGIDTTKFREKGTSGIARGKRKYGEIATFKFGDADIPCQAQARVHIFVPAYKWMLENRMQNELLALMEHLKQGGRIVFLDYSTSEDINDTEKRFSHAVIIKAWLLNAVGASMA